jgi:hypothetical protein
VDCGERRSRSQEESRPQSNRFVTGVNWADREFWYASSEGDGSELRPVESVDRRVLEILEMPLEANVSGLESDGGDRFFCGGQKSGTVREPLKIGEL